MGRMVLLCAAALLTGNTAVTFTPTLSVPAPGWGLAAYLVFLLIPVGMRIWDNIQWHRAVSAGFPKEETI